MRNHISYDAPARRQASVIDALREEHEVILRALALLEDLCHRIEAGVVINRESLAWLLGFFRAFVDRCHHAKEERCLFPSLERHGASREGGPLEVMRSDHGAPGMTLPHLKTEVDDTEIVDAVREYATLLRAHIRRENDALFPLAERILPAEEQRHLRGAFAIVEREEIGPGGYERLRAELDRLDGVAPRT